MCHVNIKSGKYNAKSVPRFLPKHKHEKLPGASGAALTINFPQSARCLFPAKIITAPLFRENVDGKMKGINRQILLLSSNI
jgi:hypothetical protein